MRPFVVVHLLNKKRKSNLHILRVHLPIDCSGCRVRFSRAASFLGSLLNRSMAYGSSNDKESQRISHNGGSVVQGHSSRLKALQQFGSWSQLHIFFGVSWQVPFSIFWEFLFMSIPRTHFGQSRGQSTHCFPFHFCKVTRHIYHLSYQIEENF